VILNEVGGDDAAHVSCLVTTIRLQRQSWHYAWEILLPLLALVSVVWSIFRVEIESLADRLNIAFIGVLTIVAYRFVLAENTPRMNYLTLLDSVLIGSFVMMAATVPQSERGSRGASGPVPTQTPPRLPKPTKLCRPRRQRLQAG